MLNKTVQQLKSAFYHNVICTNGTKRLVANCPKLGSSNGECSGRAPLHIFVPDEHSEYDLVLSLCQDGTQRITLDWDRNEDNALDVVFNSMPNRPKTDIAIVTPSTSHWHIWGQKTETWTSVVDSLFSCGNSGYYEMNANKGFCSLRPPWKLKDDLPWEHLVDIRFNGDLTDATANFDWSKANDTPPPPPGVSLEDLFAEDGE
jgi:hypothetical protein